MFYLIIVIFSIGIVAIALEHRLSIDKAAVAMIIGALVWICIALGDFDFVPQTELYRHIGAISEILFYLLGSMTIVEIIDSHGGFNMLSNLIKTHKKVKLLWIFSILAFFLAAVLGNLTATILMITFMWKLVGGKNTRLLFTGMIVIAANAGGVWSPIGDVTTIMLWIGGQLSALNIIRQLFIPSLVCMLVPLVIVSFGMKGDTVPPSGRQFDRLSVPATNRERWIIMLTGMLGSLFVPVFKHIAHLPPYMCVMLVVGIMWIMTEIMHRRKQTEIRMRLTLVEILKKIDIPTIFFLLGILLTVAGLESAGHLSRAGIFLDEKIHNIYVMNLLIGAMSSILDNVMLVAGTVGIYEIVTPEVLAAATPENAEYLKHFAADGSFWELHAYCTGTGGSVLIVGSAAGVAAMGMAKIDFMWYLKKISLLALAGYLAGIAAYYLIVS